MRVLLIRDNVVVNLILADDLARAQAFYPNFECMEQPASGSPSAGWRRINGEWQPPLRVVRDGDFRITRLAFLSRLTDAEAITFDLASVGATVPAATLRRFMQKINAATYINLDDPLVLGALQQLEAFGILAQGRASQIVNAPVLYHERPARSQS